MLNYREGVTPRQHSVIHAAYAKPSASDAIQHDNSKLIPDRASEIVAARELR